uniref:Ribonuclease H1 n=1 Tax=Geotrypetes seraphini TaxID=260995 RepID=A0A6P8Q5Y4_GEOSA|nr:ribonuclease H1-like [Geotrypetes seraphini]
MNYYYAVRTGRQTGVFHTWEECKDQVHRFPSARYKKFNSANEAWDFVNSEDSAGPSSGYRSDTWYEKPSFNRYKRYYEQSSSSEDEEVYEPRYYEQFSSSEDEEVYEPKCAKYTKKSTYKGNSAVVYTDGCCASNGRSDARAGIGVYWGPNHPLNVAERLSGRQTNQRAEIQAACRAIKQAKSENVNKLVLCTDSMFTINGITKWAKNWRANDWKRVTGEEVVNKKDFKKLENLSRGMDITWRHVPAHSGYPGNEAADKLARAGLQKRKRN